MRAVDDLRRPDRHGREEVRGDPVEAAGGGVVIHIPVSYTHLDVYKRQREHRIGRPIEYQAAVVDIDRAAQRAAGAAVADLQRSGRDGRGTGERAVARQHLSLIHI